MIALTLAEVAEATGGSLPAGAPPQWADLVVTAVVADSREPVDGALFACIPGERVDGHDFAEAVVQAGGVACLVSRSLASASIPCVVVDDTVAALGRLAHWYRRERLSARVVAVTGSSGKTTTKDLLAQVLSSAGPTVAPRGSFNTEVGLPLTVLTADAATAFLVLEMGMRGLGHIADLMAIAEPEVGVLLNVGTAHLAMVGSREGIAQAKGEIVETLPASGTAVLNGDDPLAMSQARRTAARVVTFGESAGCEVRATDVRLDEGARASFVLEAGGQSAPVSLRLAGEHMVANALAVAAVALVLGLELSAISAALSAARPVSRWRMEVTERADGVTVVNDAYNANPESMRAALKALVAMAGGRRTWAVLGEMRELGPEALAEHDAIGRLAVRLDVSKLVCVGDATKVMHLAAANEGSWGDEAAWCPGIDEAIAMLDREIRPGDIVLVKASRSVGLVRVAQALLAGSDAASPGEVTR